MKLRKIVSLFVAVLMLISSIPFGATAAAGDVFTAGDFKYTVNSDGTTVTLTAIAAEKLIGEITVPATVSDGTNTYTVTQLGGAFKNVEAKTREMTSLVLPDTITKITVTAAFYACKGLTSIKLPKNLTGDTTDSQLTSTFQYCNSLTTVEIPAGITRLYGSFKNSAVRTVYLKTTAQAKFFSDVPAADMRAWNDGTTGITIYYPENGTAPVGTNSAGVFTATVLKYTPAQEPEEEEPDELDPSEIYTYTVVSEEEKTIYITGGKSGVKLSGEVIIPSQIDGYTVIGTGHAAFSGELLKNVTSVTIPDTIKRIGDYNCFYDCKNLQEIILPEEMEYLGVGTFTGCTSLTSIVIPKGVTKLSKTFRRCTSLETVTIPSSVTEIDAAVFASTDGGTDIMPGITIKCAIGSYADRYAKSKGINVIYSDGPLYTYTDNGDNTITITDMADDVEIIGTLEIPAEIDGKTVTGIGDGAFRGREDITSITLPETIDTIGTEAFAYCSNISVFEIPDGVETLDNTFLGCSALSVVTIPESVTNISDDTFYTDSESNGGTPIPGLTIYCMEGSAAETYAIAHSMSYEAEREIPAPWDGTVDTSWYNSEADTYEISNGAQLAGLRHLVNTGTELFYGKTVNLTADINMAGSVWKVGIGYYTPTTAEERAFNGTFNGNEYIIYNFTYNSNATEDSVSDVMMPDVLSHLYHGLFGVLGTYGKITNLGMENTQITVGSKDYKVVTTIGALVGMNNGEINHCYLNNTKFAGGYWGSFCDQRYGGICAANTGSIEDCFVKTIDFTDVVAQYNATRKAAIAPGNAGSVRDCYVADIIYDNGEGFFSWKEDGSGDGKCSKMYYYDPIVFSNTGTVENVYSDDNFTRNGWTVGVRSYDDFSLLTDKMTSAMEKLTFRTIASAEAIITIQTVDGDLTGINPEVQIVFTQQVDAQTLTGVILNWEDTVVNSCNITSMNDAAYPKNCTVEFQEDLIWNTEYQLTLSGVKDLWNRDVYANAFSFQTAKEIVYREFAIYENYGTLGERKLTSLENVSGPLTAVIKGLKNNGTETYNAVFSVSAESDGQMLKGSAKVVNIAPLETKSSDVVVGAVNINTYSASDLELQAVLYKAFGTVVPLVESVEISR